MFIKVSEEAKQRVSPSGFWLAVGLAVLLIVFICVSVQSGEALWHSPKVNEFLLAAVWALTVFHVARHGRRALAWPRVALLVGYTLFIGGQAWPHSLLSRSWVQAVGELGILVGILSPYIEFRRGRRVPASGESGTNSPV